MEKTLFETYKEEVLADAVSLGFDISKIEEVELFRMPWARCGECCRTVRTGKYTIRINEKDFMDSRMTRRMRLRLIMHEICHAQEGCLDHGKKWRATAGLAENAFPDKYRGITDNFDGADMQAALARYMFKCPVCDYVYGTRSKRDRAMQGRALCPCCRVLLVRA